MLRIEGPGHGGQYGDRGVHQVHQDQLRRSVRVTDADGIGPRPVGGKGLHFPSRDACVLRGQQAVFRLQGHRPQRGIEGLRRHVDGVAAAVRRPDKNVLQVPTVGIGSDDEGEGQVRLVGDAGEKVLRRGGLARLQGQQSARGHGRHGVPDDERGGVELAVVFTSDIERIRSAWLR